MAFSSSVLREAETPVPRACPGAGVLCRPCWGCEGHHGAPTPGLAPRDGRTLADGRFRGGRPVTAGLRLGGQTGLRAGRFPGISWMCCCHFFSPRVVQGLCGGSRGGRGTLCPWSRQLTGAGRAKLDLRPRAGSLPLREKKGAGAQRDLPPADWGPLHHPWAGAGEPGVQPAVGTRSRPGLASVMLGGPSPLLPPPPFQVASPGSLEGLRPARGQPGLCVIETPPPAGAPGTPRGSWAWFNALWLPSLHS